MLIRRFLTSTHMAPWQRRCWGNGLKESRVFNNRLQMTRLMVQQPSASNLTKLQLDFSYSHTCTIPAVPPAPPQTVNCNNGNLRRAGAFGDPAAGVVVNVELSFLFVSHGICLLVLRA